MDRLLDAIEKRAWGSEVAEAIGLLRCCEWTLRLRRFSTLCPWHTRLTRRPMRMGHDTYRFCKLISDTIKTTVDIGCGSGAGGMRFYSA